MLRRLQYLRTIGLAELSLDRMTEAVLRRVGDLPHMFAWRMDETARESRRRIREFRNRHAGERCVVIANGPSLRHTPMHLLLDEVTIGMNRVHLLEGAFGVRPTYAVVSDVVSQLQHIAVPLGKIPIPKFVNWNGRKHASGDEFIYFKTTFRPRFSTDFSLGIYGGHSVTFAALQLAYYMGFQKVVLVGKDHSYNASGTPTARVISDGRESNHFAAGYYEPGQLWRVPDYKGEELAYRMARAAFEERGGRVLDATVDGKLTVFQKVRLEAALS